MADNVPPGTAEVPPSRSSTQFPLRAIYAVDAGPLSLHRNELIAMNVGGRGLASQLASSGAISWMKPSSAFFTSCGKRPSHRAPAWRREAILSRWAAEVPAHSHATWAALVARHSRLKRHAEEAKGSDPEAEASANVEGGHEPPSLRPPAEGVESKVDSEVRPELSGDQGSTAEEGQPDELREELLKVLGEVKASGEGNLEARGRPTCKGRRVDKDLFGQVDSN